MSCPSAAWDWLLDCRRLNLTRFSEVLQISQWKITEKKFWGIPKNGTYVLLSNFMGQKEQHRLKKSTPDALTVPRRGTLRSPASWGLIPEVTREICLAEQIWLPSFSLTLWISSLPGRPGYRLAYWQAGRVGAGLPGAEEGAQHLHVAEVRETHGGQAGAVHQDEAAAGDAVGPEALLGRGAEGQAGGPRVALGHCGPPAAQTRTHSTHTHGAQGHRLGRRWGRGPPARAGGPVPRTGGSRAEPPTRPPPRRSRRGRDRRTAGSPRPRARAPAPRPRPDPRAPGSAPSTTSPGRHGNASFRVPVPMATATSWRRTRFSLPPPPPFHQPTKPPAARVPPRPALRN